MSNYPKININHHNPIYILCPIHLIENEAVTPDELALSLYLQTVMRHDLEEYDYEELRKWTCERFKWSYEKFDQIIENSLINDGNFKKIGDSIDFYC